MNHYAKRKRVLLGAVLLSLGLACVGSGNFIDWLIKHYRWEGTSCLINLYVFHVPCEAPAKPQCRSGCGYGRKIDNHDGTCTWVPDNNQYRCGKEVVSGNGMVSCYDGPACLAGSTDPLALMGWDGLPPDTVPANVVSVSPQSRKLLPAGQGVTLKFNETMDATSVTLSGDMATEAGPYSFSRSADQFIHNDTLTIPPATEWAPGWRNVSIDVKDNTGNPSALSLSWYVLAPGQPPVPDFASCGCGQRWFLPYAVQFTASGGVPPYSWRISGEAPGHDEDLFRATGLFAGGPTFCFLCNFAFDICVADALGSETCHGVTWGSGL
jgi:hypothetical protein